MYNFIRNATYCCKTLVYQVLKSSCRQACTRVSVIVNVHLSNPHANMRKGKASSIICMDIDVSWLKLNKKNIRITPCRLFLNSISWLHNRALNVAIVGGLLSLFAFMWMIVLFAVSQWLILHLKSKRSDMLWVPRYLSSFLSSFISELIFFSTIAHRAFLLRTVFQTANEWISTFHCLN